MTDRVEVHREDPCDARVQSGYHLYHYKIDALHFCGDGLSHAANGLTHIANALPGERVTALPVPIKRRRQALLVEVDAASPVRVQPVCPQWRRCPACQFSCLAIEAQREVKRDGWLRLIRRFVDIPAQCRVDFWSAPKSLGYRHKTEAVCHRTPLGPVFGIAPRLDVLAAEVAQQARDAGTPVDLLQMDAAEVADAAPDHPVSVRDCALHAAELHDFIAAVQSAPIEFPDRMRFGFEARGAERRLIAYAEPDRADEVRDFAQKLGREVPCSIVMQVLPPRGSHVFPQPEAIAGSPWYGYINDADGNLLHALKGAWTPVNPANAVLIREALQRMMHGTRFASLLELGCGCGTHTAVFLAHADDYTGIDASWPAIKSAQHNAETYGWNGARFFTDTAEHYLDKRYYQGRRAQAIVMHSNRLPYSEKTAQLCRRFGACDVFIVAPTAYAMAQECRHFVALGYRLRALDLCDTLPMTYHMMAVAHLSRDMT